MFVTNTGVAAGIFVLNVSNLLTKSAAFQSFINDEEEINPQR